MTRLATGAIPAAAARATLPRQRPRRREQDKQTLLSTLGRGAVSGLSKGANVLDVPGSMVRDALTGRNPLDQLASPTSFENRQTGRETLAAMGLMRPNKPTGFTPFSDPGEFARDVAGFGFEVLTDPLTYLGPGLTKAGRAAQAAGILDDVADIVPRGVGKRIGRQTTTLDQLIQARPAEAGLRRKAVESAAEGMGERVEDLLSQPLGRQFGLGLPFQEPAVTFNLGRLGQATSRALDVVGGGVARSAPGRFARMLFDPRTRMPGGRSAFTQGEQEIAERMYRERRAAEAAAKGAAIEAEELARPIRERFTQELGEAPELDTAVDPRDLEERVDQVIGERMAERAATQPERTFRRKHLSKIRMVQQGRDPASIPRFDEAVEDYRRLTGLVNATEEDVMDALRRSDPRPTRTSPDVIEEAERRVASEQMQGTLPDRPFQRGDVVQAQDRGNFGYVTRVGSRESEVFFRNPDTGNTAFRVMPNDQLTRAGANAPDPETMLQSLNDQRFGDVLRMAAETGDAREAFAEIAPQMQPSEELIEGVEQVAERLRRVKDEVHQRISRKGGRANWLEAGEDDFGVHHFPRYVDRQTAEEAGIARAMPTTHGSMKARTPETRGIPAALVNRMLRERRYRGEGAARRIAEDFGEYLDPQYGRDPTQFDFGDEAAEAFQTGAEADVSEHARALASWIQERPRRDLYTRSPLADLGQYMERAELVDNSIEAVHDMFLRHAGEGDVPLESAFSRASMRTSSETGEPTALEYFAEKWNQTREQPITPDEARNITVPEEVAKAANAVQETAENFPNWVSRIGESVDKFNRIWKTGVTVPFPEFMSRNFTSGQIFNITATPIPPQEIPEYIKQMKAVHKLTRTAREAPENLTADQKRLLKEISQWRVAGEGPGFQDVDVSQLVPQQGDWIQRLVPPDPSQLARTLSEARTSVGSRPWLTDVVPGGQGTRTALRTWAATGGKLNKAVEWYNRVPLFKYLRDKGWSPEAALRKVEETQFDYSRVTGSTPFEASFMRRFMPFYQFTRKAIPATFRTLIERPGGALAQTIRGTTRAGGEQDKPLPQYLEETSAIPLGRQPDGSESYATGLGMVQEVPFGFLGGGVRRAGAETMAMTNPLVKAPLEWITGESFFQRGPQGGRELADMDPLLGRLLSNAGLRETYPGGRPRPVLGTGFEQLVANSPASRFLSTARTLTDPRKYTQGGLPSGRLISDLTTGVNVYDVSPGQQRSVLQKKAAAIAEDLGARSFEVTYIPEDLIRYVEQANPERARRMRAYNSLRTLLSREAREAQQ